MAHEASDPYGTKAWQQRVSKEMGTALQAHRYRKGIGTGGFGRNPITHQEYGYEDDAADPKALPRSRKEQEFRERLVRLESTLSHEKAGREAVQKELEALKRICQEQFIGSDAKGAKR
eukprot:TRINITY_DN21768_c0_g1_i1.p2 TRINITY_DN21768_c0_g1~~TRINITY_DN21768_c0_g1_i1.p2  ORF type:complete len:118 (+),score=46.69 TRINITY_DN21768_c0_g1_i1:134-487(+)